METSGSTTLLIQSDPGAEKKSHTYANNIKYVSAPSLSSDAFVNVPHACEGAAPFLCMVFWWCILAFVVPIAVLLPLYVLLESVHTTATITVLCLLCGAGILVCCFGLRAVLFEICCPAPLPSATVPFHSSRSLSKIEVRSIVLIVNPHGGGGKGQATLEKTILPIWEIEHKISVKVLKTERACHAVELARTIDLNGVDALCILGGDGSIHELVNGFLQRDPLPDVVLGFLPGGTGNSLMRDLRTNSVSEACHRVAKGLNTEMDANLVILPNNRIYSINEISWGLVGDVGVLSEGWRWFGPKRYDLCAMWSLFKAQKRLCELVVDDGDKTTAHFATLFVNHSQHFGKDLRACPDAILDDGLMNLVYLLDAPRAEKLLVFMQLPEGRHRKHKAVTFKLVSNVKFTPRDGAGVLNIDGENYPYQGTIEIQVIPKAFRIFVCPELVRP